jgi:acyl carrier protein phosphodiesterase
MNYLAHLFLAKDSTESLIGNMMGDFVKGSIHGKYHNKEIVKGIQLHRKVDCFTDAHPKTLESKKLMSPKRRRFAGIILDIAYDHYLSKHWAKYSDQELNHFIFNAYETLEQNKNTLPDKLQSILPRMIKENWLGTYLELSGVELTLNRISNRLKRKNALLGSVKEITRNYQTLEENFLIFFPDVIRFAKTGNI